MWPSALIGFVAALRAAYCAQADGFDGGSLLQVNTKRGKVVECAAAAQFCIAAVETVMECETEWEGQPTKCSKALCNVQHTNINGVKAADAVVLRTMCKRYVRASKWGSEGWMCRPDASKPPDARDVFCNRMDGLCDGWAIWFVSQGKKQKDGRGQRNNDMNLCKTSFVQRTVHIFKEGPGCTAYDHNFPGFASEGLPDISAALEAAESSFEWEELEGTPGCSEDHVKQYKLLDIKRGIPLYQCMGKCERLPNCRALNFKLPKVGGRKGTCVPLEQACDGTQAQATGDDFGLMRSFKLARDGTELLQSGTASESEIAEAADPLSAELAQRSLLQTVSSHNVIDQLLESTTRRKSCVGACS